METYKSLKFKEFERKMRNMAKENKTLIFDYVFDSDYAVNDDYEEYDGEDFEYEVDIDEAKEIVVDSYIDLINGKTVYDDDFIKILNELEDESLVDWNDIFNKNWDYLKEHYEKEAMEWFIDEHYIMSDDEYRSHLADMYNDDKWLREHGE